MVFLSDPQVSPDVPSHFQCGGALVVPTKVVTAAHCVDETVLGNLDVVGGRTDLRDDDGEVRKVVSIFEHRKVPRPPPPPGSNAEPRPGGDVAVLTLDRPMPYRTIPLASPADADTLYRAGTPAWVLGWGISSEEQANMPPAQAVTPALQRAQLPLVSDQDCQEAALHGSPWPVRFDPAHYVCAGYEHGGVAISAGDSGGPLVVDGKLAGVATLPVVRGDEPSLSNVLSGSSRITTFHSEIIDHLTEP